MQSATVLLFCGLPGCGKSTLARRVAKKQSDIIEYDAIARELLLLQDDADMDSLEAWRQTRTVALHRLDEDLHQHFVKCHQGDKSHRLIVMDDNFHLRSMRKDVYRVCQKYADERLYFGIVWLDAPLQLCLERNRGRRDDARVPDDVIQNIHRSFEPPDEEKASWEVNSLRVMQDPNTTEDDALGDVLLVFVDKTCRVQPSLRMDHQQQQQQQQQEREATRANVQHRCDGWMRSWVGCVAQVSRPNVGHANQARRNILQQLKSGHISMEEVPTCYGMKERFLQELQRLAHTSADWTDDRIQRLQDSIDQQQQVDPPR